MKINIFKKNALVLTVWFISWLCVVPSFADDIFEFTAINIPSEISGIYYEPSEETFAVLDVEFKGDVYLEETVVGLLVDGTLDNTISLRIQMPCGEIVAYKNISDIPGVSTHCPCGAKKHWIVKYK